MSRVVRLAGVVLIAAASVGAFTVTPAAPAHAAPPTRLRMIDQSAGFNVSADGTLAFVVEAPSDVRIDELLDADVIVTAYAQITTRAEVVAVADDGVLPRAIDTVDLPLASIARPTPQQLLVVVPSESATRTEPALQLPRAGLYPLVIDIRAAGEVVAEVVTFVHRLPDPADEPLAALNVAVAVGTTAPVTLDTTGAPSIGTAGDAEMAALADVLDAAGIPLTVRIEPQALVAVQRDDPDLGDRLVASLAAHDVLAAPRLPLDPSAIVAAGQEATYTDWLREGEDLLAAQAVPTQRTLSFVTAPLSTGGARLLRDLGSRMFLLTPEIYDATRGSFGVHDPTQLVRVRLDDTAELDAAIVDRSLMPVLDGGSDPRVAAVRVVTELLAMRQQISDFGGDPRRHSVVLAAPGIGLPDPTLMATASTLLGATPGLRVTTLADIGTRTDVLIVDGQEVRVDLPAATDADITDRVTRVTRLRISTEITGSMLPDTDPRPALWDQRISLLPSSALDDAAAQAIDAGITVELGSISAAIEPPAPFAFTLTGRNSSIRLRFRNTSDTPLTIRIRMASAKLVFPNGDQLAVLAPDAVTEVEVPVEARTNGRFPVSLQVFAPVGDADIVPPVPLTARVNALTGLGNLVTGAAVLVLIAWWARHFDRTRRRRNAAHVIERHPVGGARREPDAALSPDAETSTLNSS
jgi:hypothetical protein